MENELTVLISLSLFRSMVSCCLHALLTVLLFFYSDWLCVCVCLENAFYVRFFLFFFFISSLMAIKRCRNSLTKTQWLLIALETHLDRNQCNDGGCTVVLVCSLFYSVPYGMAVQSVAPTRYALTGCDRI